MNQGYKAALTKWFDLHREEFVARWKAQYSPSLPAPAPSVVVSGKSQQFLLIQLEDEEEFTPDMEYYDMTYVHGYMTSSVGKNQRHIDAVITCNQVIYVFLKVF